MQPIIVLTPLQLEELVIKAVKNYIENAPTTKPTPSYLTRTEVAERLKVSESTIDRWVKERQLKAYYIGNKVYFLYEDIEQALTPLYDN